MKRIDSAVKTYQEDLRKYLHEELLANGGSYEKWYDDLEQFREFIKTEYVWLRLGKEMYAYQPRENQYGDKIDHHIVSYLAPLDYTRIGFNGQHLKPYEQVEKASQYVNGKGKRFIAVALPNKGAVYPKLICDKPELYNQKTSPAPQYRKHISDLLGTGVEVIDIFPVFKDWADKYGLENLLFSKDHHISPLGAKLIAESIADYLKKTTDGLSKTIDVKQAPYYYYDNSASVFNLTKIWINFIVGQDNTVVRDTNGNSSITIFGDCNLQSYSNLGAGILGNLTYSLQYPIIDAGRMLLFDYKSEADNHMSKEAFDSLLSSDIVIYLAFSSAGFVRSSHTLSHFGALKGIGSMIIKEHSFSNYKWANFEL